MDEIKKDELGLDGEMKAADTEEADSKKADTAADDPLKQELDDLRDLFQQELDKATQGEDEDETAPNDDTEDGGEFIQALEDVESCDDSDETPPALCECCGECPRSQDFGEDYPYCDSCRELMKRYPLRASGIIMAALMFAVFVLSIYFSAGFVNTLGVVAANNEAYKEGRILSSMGGYYTYVSSTAPEAVSKRAVKELYSAFLKTGYYSDAQSLIESFYDESDLKLPWNKKYRDFLKKNDELVATYYATREITLPVLEGKEYDYNKVIAELDALLTSNPVEDGKSETAEKYDAVFTEYYKFVVMSMHGESLEDQLDQLKKIDSINKDDLEWVYLSNYCAVAAKLGNEALAKELFERAVAINKQDMNSYLAYASCYRYTEKPDPDKMLEICAEAKQWAYNNDDSYTPNMVIAYLLKGDYDTALETMKTYVAGKSYTLQNCNLLALCAAAANDAETYEQMEKVLASGNYEVSELVKKYTAGKLTIEQVLADNGGEI